MGVWEILAGGSLSLLILNASFEFIKSFKSKNNGGQNGVRSDVKELLLKTDIMQEKNRDLRLEDALNKLATNITKQTEMIRDLLLQIKQMNENIEANLQHPKNPT